MKTRPSAGRQGAIPDLIKLPTFQHEVDYLADRVQQLHERDIPWNEIAIIYRSNFMGDACGGLFGVAPRNSPDL